jgi:hypothetical protein
MGDYVLGIDVGIKTLSLCILSKEKIELWGVYNTITPDQLLCETCGRKAKYKLGFCGSHFKGEKIKKNEIKKTKVKSFSLQEICSKVLLLINRLLEEDYEKFIKVKKVIIELQPRFNPKMCFVSNVLFSKFCDFYTNSDVKIKFEKASVKLKKFTGDKGEYIKNTYKNRKLKSIEYVTNTLTECYSEEMLVFFTGLKVKHDASDSFLMAYNNL